jgi:hypothetical protein
MLYGTDVLQEQFSSEIKLAYQSEQARFESLVTLKDVPYGHTTKFNKSSAAGEMQAKGHFGDMPLLGGGLSRVTCTLEDYFGGEKLSPEDMQNTTADGKLVVTVNINAARERKKDSIILDALEDATNVIANNNTGLTTAKRDEIWETHQSNLIFENGELPVNMVGPKQWQQLMAFDNFINSDYVGPNELKWMESRALQGRMYNDMIWVCNPKLRTDSDDFRRCYSFVKSAVGFASSSAMTDQKLGFNEEKNYYWYWAGMRAGAVIIDNTGLIEFVCDETPD